MAHQDWTPVVLRKSETKAKDLSTRQTGLELLKGDLTSQAKDTTQEKKQRDRKLDDADGEQKAHARVSHSLARQLQQARVNAGLTQEQLARKVNKTVSTIRDYEKGTAIPSPAITSSLGRALGVSLKG